MIWKLWAGTEGAYRCIKLIKGEQTCSKANKRYLVTPCTKTHKDDQGRPAQRRTKSIKSARECTKSLKVAQQWSNLAKVAQRWTFMRNSAQSRTKSSASDFCPINPVIVSPTPLRRLEASPERWLEETRRNIVGENKVCYPLMRSSWLKSTCRTKIEYTTSKSDNSVTYSDDRPSSETLAS